MRSLVRRVVVLGAGALCAVALAAGSTSPPGGAPAFGSQARAAPKPGVQVVDLDAPVATGRFEVPGSPDDHVTVGVLSLEVRGKLMFVNLVFTPDFASVTGSEKITLADMLGHYRFEPWLVDRTHFKSYSTPSTHGLKSDTRDEKTVNGEPVYVWAAFAAPEDGDASFDVHIQDDWEPIVVTFG
ncbi:MAG: hypothetical protein FWE61_08495 [Micrococcales bacterium]|nr:hypothetical protein [Micrococcales bacterium]